MAMYSFRELQFKQLVALSQNSYISLHKRGLEQNCLPLAFTTAATPAVIPAQSTELINWWAFRPGGILIQVRPKHSKIPYHRRTLFNSPRRDRNTMGIRQLMAHWDLNKTIATTFTQGLQKGNFLYLLNSEPSPASYVDLNSTNPF